MKELGGFLEGFVRPLVAGGELHVGPPLDLARLERWGAALVPAETDAIDEARGGVVAQLVVRPPRLALAAEELRLAGAVYDALVLAHPDAEGWKIPDSRRRRVRDAALVLADVPAARDRRTVLSRHALLHNLFDLSRVDTEVRWWTGRAEFKGTPPPRRLIRWRAVRRVRLAEEVVRYDELLGGDLTAPVVERLLAASPLTDLLSPVRRVPAFSFAGVVDVLRDAELARAVAYAWLGDEPGAPRLGRLGAAVVPAWERLLHGSAPLADVRAVTAFLVHLAALAALAESRPGGHGPHEVPLDEGAEAGAAGVDGVALLMAIPDLAAQADPALGAPPGIDGDPALLARWQAQRARVRPRLGEKYLAELATLLRDKLAPRVASAV